MKLSRCFVSVLPLLGLFPIASFATLERSELEGLPTIAVDGVECTLTDAIQAANSDTIIGGCTGTLGLEGQ